MSIKEFIELQKMCYGDVKPSIRCYGGLKRPDLTTYNRDQLKNVFVFTGVHSVVQFKNVTVTTKLYFPFEGYVSCYDLWYSTGTNRNIDLLQVFPQYELFEDLLFNGGQFNNVDNGVLPHDVKFASNLNRSFYIVQFPFTKILDLG